MPVTYLLIIVAFLKKKNIEHFICKECTRLERVYLLVNVFCKALCNIFLPSIIVASAYRKKSVRLDRFFLFTLY